MKKSLTIHLFCFAVVIATTLFSSGCATTGELFKGLGSAGSCAGGT